MTGSNVSTAEAAVTSMKINLNAVVSKVLRENTVKKVKAFDKTQHTLEKRGLVSKETVVLRRWGSDTRKFGLSTELIM